MEVTSGVICAVAIICGIVLAWAIIATLKYQDTKTRVDLYRAEIRDLECKVTGITQEKEKLANRIRQALESQNDTIFACPNSCDLSDINRLQTIASTITAYAQLSPDEQKDRDNLEKLYCDIYDLVYIKVPYDQVGVKHQGEPTT